MTVHTVFLLCHENSEVEKDVYVGSTLLSLSQRLGQQKYFWSRIDCEDKKLFNRMKEVGLHNWIMQPLLTVDCSRNEIRKFVKMCKNIFSY